jgi:hypothetical protein
MAKSTFLINELIPATPTASYKVIIQITGEGKRNEA